MKFLFPIMVIALLAILFVLDGTQPKKNTSISIVRYFPKHKIFVLDSNRNYLLVDSSFNVMKAIIDDSGKITSLEIIEPLKNK